MSADSEIYQNLTLLFHYFFIFHEIPTFKIKNGSIYDFEPPSGLQGELSISKIKLTIGKNLSTVKS